MAPAPYEICRKIEEMAKQNSKDHIPDLFSELKKLVYELNSDLKEYLLKLKQC
jgi:hypothetical protein